MNAENLRQTAQVYLGSPTADSLTIPAFFCQTDILVKKVALISSAAIAASNTDFAVLSLKNGAVVVASLDTRAAAQGAVTANTGKAAVVDPGAIGAALCASGSTLTVSYDETDTGTNVALTNAVLLIEYVRNTNK